jgi:site-specific recombinase XerD
MTAAILPIVGTLAPLVRQYLRGRVARGELSRQSASDISYCLAGLTESFGRRPLGQYGPKAIDRWLETIGSKAPATRREYLSRVRNFSRWLVAEGYAKSDATQHVPTIRQPRQVPRTLSEREVCALLSACPDARSIAIVWLMVGCGCRCVEVARLNVEDYDPTSRTVILIGKGGHERRIPVPETTAHALDDYLDAIGRPAGPLIRTVDGQRMSSKTLSGYVRGWMRSAGVKLAPLDGRSAHTLRRTAASDVMDHSGDVRAVQEMLGHARIETTARSYLRPVSMVALRDAMEGRTYDVA